MKDFLNVVENKSCCSDMDFKTRLIWFFGSFLLGVVLLMMSVPFLFSTVIGGTKFAFLYSAGNLSCFAS